MALYYEIMDQFHEDVKAYVALDDNLATTLKSTKSLRAERKTLEERIAGFMTEQNLEVVPAGPAESNGRIRVTKSKSTSAITLGLVEAAATEFFDEATAEKFVEFLDGFRDVSEKTSVKRVKAGKGASAAKGPQRPPEGSLAADELDESA